MPAGEEMFKYHGYSGPCPKPLLPRQNDATKPIEEMSIDELLAYRRPRTSAGGYWHDDYSLVHVESFSELARRLTDLRAKLEGAYERAALTCEKEITGGDYHYLAVHGHHDCMAQAAVNCAAAIRALKEQEKKGG